jgi:ADP-ribose pyrophosphatase YjhB (NUDIX family)
VQSNECRVQSEERVTCVAGVPKGRCCKHKRASLQDSRYAAELARWSIRSNPVTLAPHMARNANWLDAADWKWVQDTLPIACVDVVPVRLATDGRTIEKIGLIHRDTPHQGKRWCIVGGRMWRNESIADTASRQLLETLGPAVRFQIDADRQPDYVVQYFTTRRSIGFVDPRQHALTLAIVVPITGDITAMGEAESFSWFDPDTLPSPEEWGFGQDKAAEHCVANWTKKSA